MAVSSSSLSEAAFRLGAESELAALADACEDHIELETELTDEALRVEYRDYVLLFNVHATTQQIWYASPFSGGQYFAFSSSDGIWRNIRTQAALRDVFFAELSKLFGDDASQ